MATKPSVATTWATTGATNGLNGSSNRIIPPAHLSTHGWAYPEPVYRNILNYWMNSAHTWVTYFEDTVDELEAESATVESSGNAIVSTLNDIFERTGEVKLFPNTSLANTAGYLPMHGDEYSRTTYSDLYNVIGDSYGVGDGSTTFNVPFAEYYSNPEYEYPNEYIEKPDANITFNLMQNIAVNSRSGKVWASSRTVTDGDLLNTPFELYSTEDNGTSWQQSTLLDNSPNAKPISLAIDTNSSDLFLGSSTIGDSNLYKSVRGEEDFQVLGDAPGDIGHVGGIPGLAVDRINKDIYIAYDVADINFEDVGGVYKLKQGISTNTWEEVGDISLVSTGAVLDMAFDSVRKIIWVIVSEITNTTDHEFPFQYEYNYTLLRKTENDANFVDVTGNFTYNSGAYTFSYMRAIAVNEYTGDIVITNRRGTYLVNASYEVTQVAYINEVHDELEVAGSGVSINKETGEIWGTKSYDTWVEDTDNGDYDKDYDTSYSVPTKITAYLTKTAVPWYIKT